MKAQMKKIDVFEVTVGETIIGKFEETDKWEGFSRLRNQNGEILIIANYERHSALSGLFDLVGHPIEKGQILKASPSLLEKIHKAGDTDGRN